MADILCGYSSDRGDVIVAYVYDEIEPAERAAFDSHLAACGQCRQEVAELRGVREQLAHWSPPEPSRLVTIAPPVVAERRRSWWRDMPVWAEVAAALVFLGVASGLANLDIRYDRNGLTLRTGWASRSTVVAERTAPAASQGTRSADTRPWGADLAALERQLRTDFDRSVVDAVRLRAAATKPSASTAVDAEVARRVRAMIDESERRQQRELALRIAQVVRDVNAQRQADLVRIDRTIGQIQNNTGVEVMKQRELLNYMMRVSLQK